MYNVLLLDDALEDLKSQKKKIVSKTSRKNCCYGSLQLVYARNLHQPWSTVNLSKKNLGWTKFQVLDDLPSLWCLWHWKLFPLCLLLHKEACWERKLFSYMDGFTCLVRQNFKTATTQTLSAPQPYLAKATPPPSRNAKNSIMRLCY